MSKINENTNETTNETNEIVDDTINFQMEELNLKISVLEDKLLRALADGQNIQKKSEKEKTDILKYSISTFAKDILLIRDNLQMALANCIQNSNAIIEGVELTMKELDKILLRHGISVINALNEKFDPNFHQAMLEIPNEETDSGTVIQIMQDGFMIHDRLLRPVLVGVSKK